MCWAIQNNAKTDRNIFFGSKNLRALAERLDDADKGVQAGSASSAPMQHYIEKLLRAQHSWAVQDSMLQLRRCGSHQTHGTVHTIATLCLPATMCTYA
jgi:hypothetical protein